METKFNIKPRVSVVIPTRNRWSALKDVLYALERQDCSRYSFEVVVVDDGSNDETPQRLEEFGQQTNIQFRYVKSSSGAAGNARNIGIENSNGDLVLFLDTDTVPANDVVRQHLKLHNQFVDTLGCIMGNVKMADELVKPEQARLWETDWSLDSSELQQVDFWKYRTANTSLQRSLFDIAGGFHNKMVAAEDTELAYRLNKMGVQFFYDNSIVATHYHPMDLKDFLKKASMYGTAVGCWYLENKELRKNLVLRYGVYARELPFVKKFKYGIRVLFVNRLTMPFILLAGKITRRVWLDASEILYNCAYRYKTRRAFHKYLATATGK